MSVIESRVGDERLSDGKSKDPGSSGKKGLGRKDAASSSKPGARNRKPQGDVGRALRSVYDSTLAEEVPTDFLDLLGKLD